MFYHRYFTTFPVYLYICIVNDLWENHVKIRNLYLDEIEFPLLISFFLSVRFYTIHKWDVQISDGSLGSTLQPNKNGKNKRGLFFVL